jgi:hypothetical protein
MPYGFRPVGRLDFLIDRVATCGHSLVWSAQHPFLLFPFVRGGRQRRDGLVRVPLVEYAVRLKGMTMTRNGMLLLSFGAAIVLAGVYFGVVDPLLACEFGLC